jgi:hypothetical protein
LGVLEAKMNSEKTMKTPTDILNDRNAELRAGRLAHTPNGRGEFYARIDCPCYTCRDVLDPTGEEDAKLHNEALMAALCKQANIPPPPPSPALTRQNAVCLNCEETHCCETECDPKKVAIAAFLNTFDYAADGIGPTDTVPLPSLGPSASVALGPSPTGSWHLPPPPPIRRHPSTTSSDSILSPIVGLQTPRSISEPLSIEEKTHELEMKLQPRLCKLLRTYQQLQEHIELLQGDPSLKHDEMAMYDAWWTEVDGKIATMESLIGQLPD